MNSPSPSRVLVMPEYGVDLPLWDRSPRGVGTLDVDDLGISDESLHRR